MSAVTIDANVALAAEHLARLTRAEAVVLFGSRARGEAGPDSDWDLCVILPDDIRPQQFTAAGLWKEVSRYGAPIQVYPVRRSVFLARSGDLNSVSHDVLADGQPIIGSLLFATGARDAS
jgi:predicted nucleotidyltransferase